jgi:phosphopantothenoylcysteine synthetase/decarboxylase
MPSYSPRGRVLYLIVCAAPPARTVSHIVKHKQADGWDVCVIATPMATQWIDVPALEQLTGHPVRSEYRHPDADGFEPLGTAVLVAPATFNTINKWANGINDTLALGLLNEALGRDIPIEAQPYVNDALARHPAYQTSLKTLARQGVSFTNPR